MGCFRPRVEFAVRVEGERVNPCGQNRPNTKICLYTHIYTDIFFKYCILISNAL